MTLKIKRTAPQFVVGKAVSTLRDVQVGTGLPSPEDLSSEFKGYMEVLVGRVPPPVDNGVMTLMEVADAYFARAMEVTFLLHEAEREGAPMHFKGSSYYQFRTGELRDFTDLAKRAADLGSRRLTQERLEFDAIKSGVEL